MKKKLKSISLEDIREIFTDDDIIEKAVDAKIIKAAKDTRIYVKLGKNLAVELSVPIWGEEREYVCPIDNIKSFEDSLFWLCENESSSFNPTLAKKWIAYLRKTAHGMEGLLEESLEEIDKAHKA